MTSYLKASLWLFAAVPSVPSRHLADGADAGGSQRVFDPVKVETLASAAGCREYVEVRAHDLLLVIRRDTGPRLDLARMIRRVCLTRNCLLTAVLSDHDRRLSSPISWN